LCRESERRADDVTTLTGLLNPQSSDALQRATIERLGRLDDERIPTAVLTGWKSYSPGVRGRILEMLLGRARWTESLLAHLERGTPAPGEMDAARRQSLLSHSDDSLRQRAEKLFAASATTDRTAVVQNHRDVLALAGDAARGKNVFAKKCANCHVLEGAGHAVGPDLAAITNRTPDAVLVALLDPNRAVEDKFVNYQLLTTDGRQLAGILADETGTSVTLLTQDGKREVVLRSEIDRLQSTGKSLMPEGLEKDFSKDELRDVIAYVAGFGPPPKQFEGNQPATVAAAADGSLTLLAAQAAIYGPTLVFERQFGNLGYWSSADDRAAWTIDVPADGSYRVVMEYACRDDTAGNALVIECGSATLSSKVAGTGDWDDYRQLALGELKLRSGMHTLTFRSQGAVRNHLIDLRGLRLTPVR
jgi:putative heme-binding domain-containing protein